MSGDIKKLFKIHPFFLTYNCLETENKFQKKRTYLFNNCLNYVLIYSSFILVLITRIILLVITIVGTFQSDIILEIVWLILVILSSFIDLILTKHLFLLKFKGVVTILTNYYILAHSVVIYYFNYQMLIKNYYPAYVLIFVLQILIVVIILANSWFPLSISLIIGTICIIVFPFSKEFNIGLFNKILIPIVSIIICVSFILIVYNLEKIARRVFTGNQKMKLQKDEMLNILKIFPNEILIVNNNKCQFINNSFNQSFPSKMNIEVNNYLINWDDLLNIGKKLKFENTNLTFDQILIDPENKAEINQGKNIIFKFRENDPEIFTYRAAKITFNNQESWIIIMSNETCYKKLERAKEEKIEKHIQITQITHDMRSPLSSMIQAEEALEITRLDSEQEEVVQILKNSTQLLYILVNDCLDLFQKEETVIKPAISLFHIRDSLNFCFQLMKFSYKKKGIELIVIIDQQLPKEINSDENRFKRILINLLGNALKFTSLGYVKVKVKYDNINNFIIISVRDTGKGMSENDLQKLFKRFGKLNDDTGQNLTGIGIGLTVCKDLSKALGGDIDVKSEINVGTKFCFWILKDFSRSNIVIDTIHEEKNPILKRIVNISNFSEPTPLFLNPNPVNSGNSSNEVLYSFRENDTSRILQDDQIKKSELDLKKPNMLIVDDDPQIVYTLSYLFTKKKFNCDKCFNGLDALNLVRSKLSSSLDTFYKLIIMDNQMPIMTGIESLKEIKKLIQKKNLTTKIVICTAEENQQIIKEIQINGGEYATKPLNIKKINQIISDIDF